MPVISVRVDRRVYEALDKLAKERGLSLYKYVKRLLEEHINAHVSAQVSGEVSVQVSAQEVERKLSELTSRIDNVLKAIQLLQESDKALAERLSALESKVNSLTRASSTSSGSSATSSSSGKRRAIEILKERKVRCVSEMRGARNPEAIIESMKREGAVVVRTEEDVCAVDPEFWEEFRQKLSEAKSPKDEDVLSRLRDDRMKKLFQLLRKAGALYLDNKSKSWVYDYAYIEEPSKAEEAEEVEVEGEELE
jgi:chaperonin cofactor prefoldin